ncbi:MAG: hypothetical protein ACJA1A_002772 [Saprospiraceae bacterium]|jgi:hypothetical protein|tara:strand:+ start:620 stop:1267 length:648 start_codon:yes stop_codon:yes gene_type:complete
MNKLYLIILLILPLVCFSQSNAQVDKSIDSLTFFFSSSTTLSERTDIFRQKRNLLKIKQERSSRIIYPNLDSINQAEIRMINDLWTLSTKSKITPSYRDSLYSVISKHKIGLDIMIDNVEFMMWDINSMSLDDFSNYPVFMFLSENFSSCYFDYIDEKVCEDSFIKKLDFLLLTTYDAVQKSNFNKQRILSLLDKECVGIKQKEAIELYLSIFEN